MQSIGLTICMMPRTNSAMSSMTRRDKNNLAVRNQADKTLAAASELNHLMVEHRFTDKLQRDWDMLRSNLNALARVYDLSPLDAGGPGQ